MGFLTEVEKPSRYAGGELNSVCKEEADVRFALCFPDVYEVGMSHFGMQVLYEALNEAPWIAAERAYMPWVDMLKKLREAGEPLRSLESGRPLGEFDMVGFSLSYELGYSNVLAMLDLAGFPLLAKERTEGMPVIVGGGQCTVNPEPVADFFDLFDIGEGEEVSRELAELMRSVKRSGGSREDFLRKAAKIDGVYVPKFYVPQYNADGTIKEIHHDPDVPSVIRRRFVRDFENAPTVTKPVVPYTGIVHDRFVLEIMRGCSNGCRFCQAGYATRPVRERSAAKCLEIARQGMEKSGYEEIGLCSLSSGDYSQIEELLTKLIDRYSDQHVSVSLPSLRVNSFSFAEKTQQVRKKGLTFAPEAGTQRLRDVINKNVTEEDVLRAAREAFESGATHVKLYFMIGLPTETDEDLEGIADLVKKVREEFSHVPREKRTGRLEIAVGVSNFVPKPVTPFQWEPQDKREELDRKQQFLRERLRMRGVKYSYHDTQTSFLEAVLARGDRKLSQVLLRAYENGAVLDAWREQFRPEAYFEAFEASGIDPEFYANRRRDPEEVLPYQHIDARIDAGYLKRELARAKEEKTTSACTEQCAGCGLQNDGCLMHKSAGERAEE